MKKMAHFLHTGSLTLSCTKVEGYNSNLKDSSCQNLVLHASSDVDIYENIKQTSLCEVTQKM